ncbi:hypothetical protein [Cryobacterium sp. W22_MBD10_FK3]|uniref:hypothetical protein n=1 Tax=Cryobacterium sp. W22_MBD10_FK3 TaxID=3240273 RepID=UPI003F8EC425
MKLDNKVKFGATGVLTLALLAAGASMASAAVQANGSDAPLYMYDTDGVLVPDSAKVWGFEEDNYGSGTDLFYADPTLCPIESTGAYVFISPVGTERTALTWKATSTNAFNPAALPDAKQILAPTLTPSTLTNGDIGAVRAAGGKYSLGVACTTNDGVTVLAAFYRTISMTAGTGAYAVTGVDTTVVTPPVEPPAPAGTQGTVALEPTVTGAVNGVLSLSIPAGAAATFNTPTLVNNKSTTTGTLGAITVNDGRVLTVNGWELSASVADFVNSADATSTIGKTQLGFAPTITAAGTTATGLTAAAAQVAGSASYPAMFASAAAGNTVGASVLDAGLTFVAPQAKTAGTYKSTMTLTVVSK